jgi:FkbM family methyltransferase
MFGNWIKDDRCQAARLRRALARLFRSMPHFPGKQRLSHFLNWRLTSESDDQQAIVTTRLADGSLLRLDLRSATEWPAFWNGCYDRRWLDLLAPRLPRNAVVIDVGANVGFYTIPLGHRLLRLQGRVVAIEPVPSNFARLCENVALNCLESVVKPLRLALGAEPGNVQLQRDAQHGAATGNAVMIASDAWGRPNAAALMTTLDRLAAEQDIQTCHLIKADIEGGELALLQGGQGFLRRCRPLLLCEVNRFWMERFGWTFQDLQALARSLDYRLYQLRGRRLVPARSPTHPVEDLLLVPASHPLQGSFHHSF